MIATWQNVREQYHFWCRPLQPQGRVKSQIPKNAIMGTFIYIFLMKLCVCNQHWGMHEICNDLWGLICSSCPRGQGITFTGLIQKYLILDEIANFGYATNLVIFRNTQSSHQQYNHCQMFVSGTAHVWSKGFDVSCDVYNQSVNLSLLLYSCS